MDDLYKLKLIEKIILQRVDDMLGKLDWYKTEDFKVLNEILGIIDGTRNNGKAVSKNSGTR